jgi:hypothetical protein
MSVFNIFLNSADKSFDSQFKATGTAAGYFNTYRNEGHPKESFQNFILGLINKGLFVTYRDNSQEVVPDLGLGKLYYYPGGDTKIPRIEIKLDALQDKASQDKIHMIVPSDPIDLGSTYLKEAVLKGFMGAYTEDQKMAFLMGMLLLKRCR